MKPIAASVAAALLLAGCGPTFPTIDSAALAEAVAQVRAKTIEICNYYPSNASLVAILVADHPVVETVYSIGKQICDAVMAPVPPLTAAQAQAPKAGDETQCRAMVRGVCIEGRFGKPEDAGGPMIHPLSPESKS